MPLSCPDCSAEMPETAGFCPGCGRAMQPVIRAQGKVGGLPENIAGSLAYLTFFPAIVFLLLDPYKKNAFVRFHSFQCIFLSLASLLMGVTIRLLGILLSMLPVVGYLLFVLISIVIGLAAFLIWLVLLVKAFQGEAFKLPVLGNLAEQQALPPSAAS
jgi:uncharacterized membrane protein